MRPLDPLVGAEAVSFRRGRAVLLLLCALFSLQGVLWIFLGSFDPFGWYEGQMAQGFWQKPHLPPDAKKTFAFLLIPFGATNAAYFALCFWLIWEPFQRREAWAYRAIVTTFLLWFAFDTSVSLVVRAFFNVWLVNLPCLFLFGLPLLQIRRFFSSPPSSSSAPPSLG